MGDEHGTKESTAGLPMERIALNDAIFREANEGIRDAADDEGFDGDELVPFVCECADPNCRELVRVTLDRYALLRADPRLFVNVPGHEASSQGWAEVVAQYDGHVIVEKMGAAGELVEQLEDAPHLLRGREESEDERIPD